MAPLETVLRSTTWLVKFVAFASRLFYLAALCTIWEIPSILTERYTLILRRVKNFCRTKHYLFSVDRLLPN